MKDNYTPVKLPNALIKEIDVIVEKSNIFTTRAGFVRYVCQYYLDPNGRIGDRLKRME